MSTPVIREASKNELFGIVVGHVCTTDRTSKTRHSGSLEKLIEPKGEIKFSSYAES